MVVDNASCLEFGQHHEAPGPGGKVETKENESHPFSHHKYSCSRDGKQFLQRRLHQAFKVLPVVRLIGPGPAKNPGVLMQRIITDIKIHNTKGGEPTGIAEPGIGIYKALFNAHIHHSGGQKKDDFG